jgi:hypothetical protein
MSRQLLSMLSKGGRCLSTSFRFFNPESAVCLSCPNVSGSWQIWTWAPNTYAGWEVTDSCTAICGDVCLVSSHERRTSERATFSPPVLTRKAYRFSISVKTGVADKSAMIEALREYTSSAPHYEAPPREELPENTTALPPLLYANDTEGWTTFEGPILYLYAGKGPYVSR